MESLIQTKVMHYLMDNDIITQCQHDFMTKKSRFTNLLGAFENWTHAVDDGYSIIDLDYRKAFVSVSLYAC